MNLIIILFLIGILLLVVEVIVPGAVLGILGACAMAGGCVVAFAQFGVGGGLLATAAGLVVLGLALWIEFRVLPNTRLVGRMFVRSTVHSTSQGPVGDDSLLGREGETLTTLAPSGYVAVEGRRYEAFSKSGHLPAGERVRVAARDTFRLIVTKV